MARSGPRLLIKKKKKLEKNPTHCFLRMVPSLVRQRQRLAPLRRVELLPGKRPGRLPRLLDGRRLAGDRLGPERALHLPHALGRGGLLVGRRLWLVRFCLFSLTLSLSLFSLFFPLVFFFFALQRAGASVRQAACADARACRPGVRALAGGHSLPAATLVPCCHHSADTRTLPPHACARKCSRGRALNYPAADAAPRVNRC